MRAGCSGFRARAGCIESNCHETRSLVTNPLPYSAPGSIDPGRLPTHEIVYRILLGVFGGAVLASGLLMISVLRNAQNPVPGWLIVYLACCYAGIALCSFAVLAVRMLWPGRFRWVTLTWNIVMLLFIPFGTALGIYGMIVLDKKPWAASAQSDNKSSMAQG